MIPAPQLWLVVLLFVYLFVYVASFSFHHIQVRGLPDNPTSYANQLVDIFSVCGPGKKIHFESQKWVSLFTIASYSRTSQSRGKLKCPD